MKERDYSLLSEISRHGLSGLLRPVAGSKTRDLVAWVLVLGSKEHGAAMWTDAVRARGLQVPGY